MKAFFHGLTYNIRPVELCKLWRRPNKTYGKFNSNFKYPKTKIVHGTFADVGWFLNVYVCVQLSIHDGIPSHIGLGPVLLNIPLTYLPVYTYIYPFPTSPSFFSLIPASACPSSFQAAALEMVKW